MMELQEDLSRGKQPTKGTQTLARGLDILQFVSSGMSEASEIAAALGTSRSTAHRVLSSLVQMGYLYHSPGSGYQLGPEILYLGARAREQQPLAQIADSHLRALAQITRDTVHLGVPQGSEVFYISKVDGTQGGLIMRSKVGQRMPMAFTGLGKAMLLAMPREVWREVYDQSVSLQIEHPERIQPRPWEALEEELLTAQRAGHAYDLEENEIGIRCVAAPIFDVSGHLVAAISVASALHFMSLQRLEELAPLVRDIASAISRDLGHHADD